jgi:hypothetical protein
MHTWSQILLELILKININLALEPAYWVNIHRPIVENLKQKMKREANKREKIELLINKEVIWYLQIDWDQWRWYYI